MGQREANKANRQEAEKNRAFQERMRNTQWQAGVADMEAAGLNPALAYQQGPNAAPGGSMAQQQDALGPATSSAMQAIRMQLELKQMKAATQKIKNEGDAAREIADRERARNFAYGLERTPEGMLRLNTSGEWPLMAREIRSQVEEREARTRRERLTGDIAQPVANLSERMGEWLPILGLLSQFNPGSSLTNVMRAARKRNVPRQSLTRPRPPRSIPAPQRIRRR